MWLREYIIKLFNLDNGETIHEIPVKEFEKKDEVWYSSGIMNFFRQLWRSQNMDN